MAAAATERVTAAAYRGTRTDAGVIASDVVGRQRVLPLVVIIVVTVVIGVNRLVHIRIVRAAVLVESVTGVVVCGRRHPIQFGVQHVVGDRGRRLVQWRPVVLQTAADYGCVHRHGYGRCRFFDRVMVGPDGVLIGRYGVRRQNGAAFPPEPPEPIARVHGQLQPDAVVAAATSTPYTGTHAAAPASAAADAAAAVATVTRRPARSGEMFEYRTVGMTRAATGTPYDRTGVPAVVYAVEMVQVVQVVQVVQLVVMIPRRYLSDLPLVMVQLLMVVMMVMHPVRGRIERHQTLCKRNKIITTLFIMKNTYTRPRTATLQCYYLHSRVIPVFRYIVQLHYIYIINILYDYFLTNTVTHSSLYFTIVYFYVFIILLNVYYMHFSFRIVL